MSGQSQSNYPLKEDPLTLFSGIVSLLFCGITLKHYAYYNMSRRTQLTTKYMFSALAQLSENFIFIYLGLTLFTETTFKPLFILITVIGICAARWCAVFPLSKAINWFIRFRSKRRGKDVADELPYSYQIMLFWAGLRGAVGVALAAGLSGANGPTLQATVLVVVVLTVIIFGGTTARMLEIMGIRTGVVEEIESDDEFDIETATNGTYYKSAGNALGFVPQGRPSNANKGLRVNGGGGDAASYSSGTPNDSPPIRPTSRNNSTGGQKSKEQELARQSLLSRDDTLSDDDFDDGDLPPAAKTRPQRKRSPPQSSAAGPSSQQASGGGPSHPPAGATEHMTATGAISQLFSGSTEEQATWFKQIDEGFIKPKLLLDQNRKGGGAV